MSVPRDATFEADLPGRVALYDVSHLLPRGRGFYQKRDPSDIRTLFLHKSGADGPAGFRGVLAMARYCVEEWGRGWPGAPYTFWASREPDVDIADRKVVYRCQHDDVVSYHTGGQANHYGIALAAQGNYDSEWDLLSTGLPLIDKMPTLAQMQCVEALVEWAIEQYGLPLPSGLSGHWEAPKPKKVCPGDYFRAYVMARRGDGKPESDGQPLRAMGAEDEIDTGRLTTRELQKALTLVGMHPGRIDGMWGHHSRRALERFQEVCGLEVDGWYGPKTAAALLAALRKRGLARRDMFDVTLPGKDNS